MSFVIQLLRWRAWSCSQFLRALNFKITCSCFGNSFFPDNWTVPYPRSWMSPYRARGNLRSIVTAFKITCSYCPLICVPRASLCTVFSPSSCLCLQNQPGSPLANKIHDIHLSFLTCLAMGYFPCWKLLGDLRWFSKNK